MPNVCLPPDLVDKFKSAALSGKINPEKLEKMSSDQRHELFSSVVGEGNAKWVNKDFETKMLLKNKQQGYATWASRLTGISKTAKQDMISRINRMDERILNPANERAFLKDLAETKLGVGVSSSEAKQIAAMSSKVTELEAKMHSDGTFPSEADRMAYGRAKVDMGTYLADLKNNANKLGVKGSLLHPLETTSRAAGFAKAIKAAFDDSALLRQNWKTLLTHPGIWAKNARKNVGDMLRQGLKGEDVMREVKADLYSRPNTDVYQKMKINIGKPEEEFGDPTLIEKTPIIGRLYKTSEVAYTALLYRTRGDLADHYFKIAQKAGVNVKDTKELEAIGKLINAETGRGDLGRFEGHAATTFNNVFFSARFVKSNFDTLTAHQFQKGVTPFVRKQAAENLVKIVTVTAGMMALANQLLPGSVEFDPRSKNFGKIKIGHTTFDITGGMGGLATLAAQIVTQSTKNSNTNIVTKLNSGYGSQTGTDVLQNFIEGKLSPAAGVVRDLMKQQDYQGNKPTVKGEAGNLLIPLPISTYQQATQDPHGAKPLLVELADALGLSANTNVPQRSGSQTLKNSKTEQAFEQKVGPQKFKEANQRYNTLLNNWQSQHKSDLNSLPPNQQQSTLNSVKSHIQTKVYKEYGYKPPKNKPSQAKKSLLETAK